MLEEKTNLLIAIRKQKPLKVVKEKYRKYCVKYNALKPNERDINDFKETSCKYLDYVYGELYQKKK